VVAAGSTAAGGTAARTSETLAGADATLDAETSASAVAGASAATKPASVAAGTAVAAAAVAAVVMAAAVAMAGVGVAGVAVDVLAAAAATSARGQNEHALHLHLPQWALAYFSWQKAMQSAAFESPLNSDWHTPPFGSPAGTGGEETPAPLPAAGFVPALAAAVAAAAVMLAAADRFAVDDDDTFDGMGALAFAASVPLVPSPTLAVLPRPVSEVLAGISTVVVQPEHTVKSVATAVVAVDGSVNI